MEAQDVQACATNARAVDDQGRDEMNVVKNVYIMDYRKMIGADFYHKDFGRD